MQPKVTVAQCVAGLERQLPRKWAEEWDKPGMSVGDPVKSGITHWSAHTNLDAASAGSSRHLGERLGLEGLTSLVPLTEATTPSPSPAQIAASPSPSPSGAVVTPSTSGEEEDGSAPLSYFGTGAYGVFPSARPLSEVLTQLKTLCGGGLRVAKGFSLPDVSDISVRKVGIVSGSGMSLVGKALKRKCDLFITGDADHHRVLDVLDKKIVICACGHFETEKDTTETLAALSLSLFPGVPVTPYTGGRVFEHLC
ncbi:GTP cyclohydrolase 1 type 2/Nif3 [Kipferlia bialata]|uniref:GTP cyclohydrolase 1 type 2/Nif3 n=1 Tax=Kipferlia bialata TaxID=797122 RepID=A0A9K3D137_9EUKA|nr:GTP cyclohydrolase 1 type 2/Nif3 [Kipferlia bialata]|eukprot:g8729.t1